MADPRIICPNTRLPRVECYCCPDLPTAPVVAPGTSVVREAADPMAAAEAAAERLCKPHSEWWRLEYREICEGCGRLLEVGEPGRHVYGRTARDMGILGWCCEVRHHDVPDDLPAPSLAPDSTRTHHGARRDKRSTRSGGFFG